MAPAGESSNPDIACDAGADPNYALDDLGNAIRKCREDIGVEIELNTKPVVLTAASSKSGDSGDEKGGDTKTKDSGKKWTQWHCVTGKIHYEMVDDGAEPGTFVYLKASLTGDEPADVLNYQTSHKDFPHESTADQWFSESQFESYRRLGQHVVETMFEPLAEEKKPEPKTPEREQGSHAVQKLRTDELFKRLKAHWPPTPEKTTEKPNHGFWEEIREAILEAILKKIPQKVPQWFKDWMEGGAKSGS